VGVCIYIIYIYVLLRHVTRTAAKLNTMWQGTCATSGEGLYEVRTRRRKSFFFMRAFFFDAGRSGSEECMK